uniref:Uncharacterized protein n=1 Tax=Candidatus Kentrum sp. LPFa TaxID=2126335 RepID=A0A450W3B2_9GAMM|nr:MAG: hypothetical protein BECKLPF1236A_GA0070988_100567 [Candidatus Kentron sp. LPFa]VFK27664.1 MAG: hypothetical protein BECKLPF1236C_GA0070990_100507 [Candidatus Kentron sp. LPFa]
MTPDDVLQELIQSLAADGDTLLPWDQVRRWPKGAVEVFQNAGWIVPTSPATEVVCPGCEESCHIPVAKVFPAENGLPTRAYVACDRRPDMGTVKFHPARLQQWQLTQGQFAKWIAGTLAFSFRGKRLEGGSLLELGLFKGKKRARMLCLYMDGDLALVAGSDRIPLVDTIRFTDGALSLDAHSIRQLVDSATGADPRYTPGNARREARKLETQAMYEIWRKAYRELKGKYLNMSDVWYSERIAGMEIGRGRSAGTIRKKMKPK